MSAGAEISLRIGQRVRHHDAHDGKRVTGIVRGLAIEGDDNALVAQVVLDAPIVIPEGHGFARIDVWHQRIPAHELAPFDEREELIAELTKALDEAAQSLQTIAANAGKSRDTDGLDNYLQGFTQVRGYAGSRAAVARADLAKATGSAS